MELTLRPFMKTVLAALLLPMLFCISAKGENVCQPTDSLKAGFLTCTPGQEVYEFYGHTALRIRNITRGEDYVFNYGLFSFNTPNFRWRFMRGDCQYEVGAAYTVEFLAQYAEQNRTVRELELNLNQQEVHRLFQALLTNCEPANRSYHYDFFYDNCATRVRDQIAACLDGQLVYTNPVKQQSLRDIVHQYSEDHPWSLFGQDLLLGAEADREATREMQQFAPIYLEYDLSTARIVENGQKRPLVSNVNELVKAQPQKPSAGFPLLPKGCIILLFLLTQALCRWEWKHPQKVLWGYDVLLLLLQGITGCIITFMFFFSAHPTVGSNWLVLLFNPLPLVFLYWTIQSERKKRQSLYHKCAFVWITLFIIAAPFIPQKFGIEIYLLALCLLLRSGHLTLCFSKNRKLQLLFK